MRPEEEAPATDVVDALARAAGLRLEAYQAGHVATAVRRAVEREGLAGPASLVRRIERDAAVRERFRAAVAVSVSGLFRDPEQFAVLERLLPGLLTDGSRLGVWSAGCADGSELYSVALLLQRLGALPRARLLGSDILEENLRRARRGRYGETEMPAELRLRCRWEVRDLTAAPAPPGRWRLILCRNVAIYLTPDAGERLVATLAAALAPGGILLVGRSEHLADPVGLHLEQTAPHAYRKLAGWEP